MIIGQGFSLCLKIQDFVTALIGLRFALQSARERRPLNKGLCTRADLKDFIIFRINLQYKKTDRIPACPCIFSCEKFPGLCP